MVHVTNRLSNGFNNTGSDENVSLYIYCIYILFFGKMQCSHVTVCSMFCACAFRKLENNPLYIVKMLFWVPLNKTSPERWEKYKCWALWLVRSNLCILPVRCNHITPCSDNSGFNYEAVTHI